uniref:Uncharacterized protein n=1 Tax=Corethron hystrix TaxID=216773 RepID=A0A7S1BGY5_9STRA
MPINEHIPVTDLNQIESEIRDEMGLDLAEETPPNNWDEEMKELGEMDDYAAIKREMESVDSNDSDDSIMPSDERITDIGLNQLESETRDEMGLDFSEETPPNNWDEEMKELEEMEDSAPIKREVESVDSDDSDGSINEMNPYEEELEDVATRPLDSDGSYVNSYSEAEEMTNEEWERFLEADALRVGESLYNEDLEERNEFSDEEWRRQLEADAAQERDSVTEESEAASLQNESDDYDGIARVSSEHDSSHPNNDILFKKENVQIEKELDHDEIEDDDLRNHDTIEEERLESIYDEVQVGLTHAKEEKNFKKFDSIDDPSDNHSNDHSDDQSDYERDHSTLNGSKSTEKRKLKYNALETRIEDDSKRKIPIGKKKKRKKFKKKKKGRPKMWFDDTKGEWVVFEKHHIDPPSELHEENDIASKIIENREEENDHMAEDLDELTRSIDSSETLREIEKSSKDQFQLLSESFTDKPFEGSEELSLLAENHFDETNVVDVLDSHDYPNNLGLKDPHLIELVNDLSKKNDFGDKDLERNGESQDNFTTLTNLDDITIEDNYNSDEKNTNEPEKGNDPAIKLVTENEKDVLDSKETFANANSEQATNKQNNVDNKIEPVAFEEEKNKELDNIHYQSNELESSTSQDEHKYIKELDSSSFGYEPPERSSIDTFDDRLNSDNLQDEYKLNPYGEELKTIDHFDDKEADIFQDKYELASHLEKEADTFNSSDEGSGHSTSEDERKVVSHHEEKTAKIDDVEEDLELNTFEDDLLGESYEKDIEAEKFENYIEPKTLDHDYVGESDDEEDSGIDQFDNNDLEPMVTKTVRTAGSDDMSYHDLALEVMESEIRNDLDSDTAAKTMPLNSDEVMEREMNQINEINNFYEEHGTDGKNSHNEDQINEFHDFEYLKPDSLENKYENDLNGGKEMEESYDVTEIISDKHKIDDVSSIDTLNNYKDTYKVDDVEVKATTSEEEKENSNYSAILDNNDREGNKTNSDNDFENTLEKESDLQTVEQDQSYEKNNKYEKLADQSLDASKDEYENDYKNNDPTSSAIISNITENGNTATSEMVEDHDSRDKTTIDTDLQILLDQELEDDDTTITGRVNSHEPGNQSMEIPIVDKPPVMPAFQDRKLENGLSAEVPDEFHSKDKQTISQNFENIVDHDVGPVPAINSDSTINNYDLGSDGDSDDAVQINQIPNPHMHEYVEDDLKEESILKKDIMSVRNIMEREDLLIRKRNLIEEEIHKIEDRERALITRTDTLNNQVRHWNEQIMMIWTNSQ